MKNGRKRNLKSSILGILLAVVMVVAGSSALMPGVRAEGDGLVEEDGASAGGVGGSSAIPMPKVPEQNADGVYQIKTVNELYWFAALVNGTMTDVAKKTDADAILLSNITINEGTMTVDEQGVVRFGGSDPVFTWEPIGDNSTGYTGTFDGNGWSISGLYINGSETNNGGFFGKLGAGASVSDVIVEDSYMSTTHPTGLIAGYNDGSIDNCGNNNCRVIGASTNVGGIVGNNNMGTITNCYNTAMVESSMRYVGGIAGINSGTVGKCYNTGSVESGTMDAGGIVGSNNKGSVINCYNTGNVLVSNKSNGHYAGGVAGTNPNGSITNCYNIGTVKAGKYFVGGITGDANGTVTNCYYLAGCAKDGNDVVQNGIGKNSLGATTPDVAGSTTSVTAEQLASGEITYKLNSGKTDGTQAWYQWVGFNDNFDAEPLLQGIGTNTVYEVEKYDCPGDTEGTVTYSNYSEDSRSTTHTDSDSNGVCDICETLVGLKPDCIEGVYQIGNRKHLYWFAGLVNGSLDGVDRDLYAKAVLTDNIVINSGDVAVAANGTVTFGGNEPAYTWTPIGSLNKKYQGTFDGNGKKVTGIYFNDDTVENVGLFGALEAGAVIQNLGVENSYLKGWNNVGGVAGYKNGGSVINCYNMAYVNGRNRIGGVVGYNDEGDVKGCYNAGTIYGSEDMVGGVVGNSYVSNGSIIGCYNISTVRGNSTVGGVAGLAQDTTLEYCYNTGTVTGDKEVGGVAGYISGNSTVNDSYNAGTINGTTSYVGGVVGNNYGGTISNCYYLADCAKIGNEVQNGIGAEQNGTTADAEGSTISVTAEQLASGEITYLLNDAVTNGTQAWYQTIEEDTYPVLDDTHETVYKRYECNGTTVIYRNVDEDVPHVDEEHDDYCDVCEEICNDIGARLSGHSVSLGGKVGVGFYMDLTQEVLNDENAYMEFTLPGGSTVRQPVSEASTEVIGEKTYYVFTGKVAAKEMANDIQAQMVCSDGNGGTKRGSIYHYSVKEYAEELIVAPYATDKEKALAKAMLNYGAYAQTYFGDRDVLANAGLSEEDRTLNFEEADRKDLQNYKPVVTGSSDIFTYAGSTLLLEADIKVRHYFRLKDDNAYNGGIEGLIKYTPQDGVFGDDITGTYYYWESAGIPVANLGDMADYTGVDGLTIRYCPLSYVTTAVVNKDGELTTNNNLQNLMKALYLYYKATK